MIQDKFKNTKYFDLTDEQLDSLSKIEMLNKFLGDSVDIVNSYIKKRVIMFVIGNILSIILLISLYFYGFLGLYLMLPLGIVFYIDRFYKKSLKWSVISLKTTISMFRGNGDFCIENDGIFIYHINRLYSVDIGEIYEI